MGQTCAIAVDISRVLHPAVCMRPVLKSFTLRGRQGVSSRNVHGALQPPCTSARCKGKGGTGVPGGPDVVRLPVLHANLHLRSRAIS